MEPSEIPHIIATIESSGWPLIREMLEEEFISGKKVTTFNTTGMSNEAIAREVAGREYAGKKVEKFLKKLEGIKAPKKVEKTDWR